MSLVSERARDTYTPASRLRRLSMAGGLRWTEQDERCETQGVSWDRPRGRREPTFCIFCVGVS